MMLWIDYYPRPGQARGVQIDIKPTHIGLKYPVDVGLTGDMKAALSALLPLLSRKRHRDFLTNSQERMKTWNAFLKRDAVTPDGAKIKPQTVCRMLSELAPSNAVYSMDAGSNTHFAARMIDIREGQRWSGTGTLVSMASGLPYGVSAAFAFPDRPSIVVAGDGGFAMLMAELSAAVLYKRNLKVLILNNDAFGEVIFEQREIGNPNYGCSLGDIDFAKFAEAVAAKGYRVTRADDLRAQMERWLSEPGVALLDVDVDPEQEALSPDKLRR